VTPVRCCGLLASLMLAACGHASPPPPSPGPAIEARSAAAEPLEAARTLGDLDAAGLAMDRSLKTLHETSEPTDLVALSIKLKESKAPWPGCEVGH